MNFARPILLSCAVLTLGACQSVIFNPPKNDVVAKIVPPQNFKVDPALLGLPSQPYYAAGQAPAVGATAMVQPVRPIYVNSADLPMLPASALPPPAVIARERQAYIVQPLPSVNEAGNGSSESADDEAGVPKDEDASWWDVIWSMLTPSPDKAPADAKEGGSGATPADGD